MVNHYAELAQRGWVNTLVIGTELERLTGEVDERPWRELIASARDRFSGAITYATTAIGDAGRVTFWDALDCIGLNLYPPLSHGGADLPSHEALCEAWTPHVSAVRELHERWELPVLVTEIGYRSATRALQEPSDWHSADGADDARQAAAYEAAYTVLSAQPWVTGVYWWDWPADLERVLDDATGYTPYGKPALDVARRWNRRLASSRQRPAALPRVSVVVPVRNGAATIEACVDALVRQTYPSELTEIVAVDNASTDGTAQILRGLRVRYLYEPRIGRSHARNRGIRDCTGDVIALIDADCVPETEWLARLIARFDSDEVSGVAGEIVSFPARTAAQRYADARFPSWQSEVLGLEEPFALTANVALRARVFDQIGTFDPAFVTAEDVDLGWRFFAAGLKMNYAPTAIVAHRLRPTARELFRQHAGYGYGRAILRERYRLRRGYALPNGDQISTAARGLLSRRAPAENPGGRAFLLYDLGVMLSVRAGALKRELARLLSRQAGVP
jgi:GT2 family glycosyltransferase